MLFSHYLSSSFSALSEKWKKKNYRVEITGAHKKEVADRYNLHNYSLSLRINWRKHLCWTQMTISGSSRLIILTKCVFFKPKTIQTKYFLAKNNESQNHLQSLFSVLAMVGLTLQWRCTRVTIQINYTVCNKFSTIVFFFFFENTEFLFLFNLIVLSGSRTRADFMMNELFLAAALFL